MIIYKNKRFVKCDLFPNSDWIGDADWVLNDEIDAELENKIIDLYPNFDFVLNGTGNIVDVMEIEPAPVSVPPAPPTNAELAASIAELAEVICSG